MPWVGEVRKNPSCVRPLIAIDCKINRAKLFRYLYVARTTVSHGYDLGSGRFKKDCLGG
jgi:hypothetical protein